MRLSPANVNRGLFLFAIYSFVNFWGTLFKIFFPLFIFGVVKITFLITFLTPIKNLLGTFVGCVEAYFETYSKQISSEISSAVQRIEQVVELFTSDFYERGQLGAKT